MTIEEKISLAKKLNEEIIKIKKFIKLFSESDSYYQGDTNKKNSIGSLTISCNIRTGTQSVNYKESIPCHQTILSCISLEALTKALNEKEKQLNGLFVSEQSEETQP